MHWSFWLIALAGLAYNLMGCANFISQMNPDRVAAMPEAVRQLVETRPLWGTAAFGIAVFGGALGAVLLLLRRPAAYPLFLASVIGALAAQLPLLGMADIPSKLLMGGLSQAVVSAFLAWYTKRAQRKGWAI